MELRDAGSPVAAFQEAILVALRRRAALTARVAGRIYDGLPRTGRTPYPYVVLGEFVSRRIGERMVEIVARLHIWSDANGYEQAQGIEGDVIGAIDRARLQVTGWHVIGLAWEETEALRDEDRDADRNLRHLIPQLRAQLEAL